MLRKTGGNNMAIKASDHFKVYHNENGPDISTLARPIIEENGLYFKDIDGSGTLSKVNDWRLSAEERAAAYVQELTAAGVRRLAAKTPA
jgi:beta-glucosidase